MMHLNFLILFTFLVIFSRANILDNSEEGKEFDLTWGLIINVTKDYADCSDVQRNGYKSGSYDVRPPGASRAYSVYCDFDFDGGTWTVLQNRFNGKVNFYRNFNEYSTGFGNSSEEHWAGLELIHQLTSVGDYELYIEVKDFENGKRYANYKIFSVDSKDKGYRLRIGNYSGTAGDSLISHNLHKFKTFDEEPLDNNYNCAILFHGAWWYNSKCHESNLNGQYLLGATEDYGKGVIWKTWKGYKYSLRSSKMMIRPIIPLEKPNEFSTMLTLEELDERLKIQEEELKKMFKLQTEKTEQTLAKMESILEQLVEQNMEYSNILKALTTSTKDTIEVCTHVASLTKAYPEDCACVPGTHSGIYKIQPVGVKEPFSVYCELSLLNEKWTVFQTRTDGMLSFYRNFVDYENGFGDLAAEHWLGLENLYQILKGGDYELYIHMTDYSNVVRFARYGQFAISAAVDGYRIQIADFSGDAGNSLSFQQEMRFSTYDKDLDTSDLNCAKTYKGAWWYASCHASNLNGYYGRGDTKEYAVGVVWSSWHGSHYSLRTTKMMIRRKNQTQCQE